ncbi:hypothetical protein GH890_30165, partial [Bacillus thuringiensis]|nr:hypothetical protein [Bacillus thuringiensis]
MVQKKRKTTGVDMPAKKAKVDAVVSLYVANLATDIEEAKIQKFFKKQGISVSDIRHKAPKTFCYVDLEDSGDLDKALALSGQKLKGQELKIEQAKSRNDPKAEKKTPQKDDA